MIYCVELALPSPIGKYFAPPFTWLIDWSRSLKSKTPNLLLDPIGQLWGKPSIYKLKPHIANRKLFKFFREQFIVILYTISNK